VFGAGFPRKCGPHKDWTAMQAMYPARNVRMRLDRGRDGDLDGKTSGSLGSDTSRSPSSGAYLLPVSTSCFLGMVVASKRCGIPVYPFKWSGNSLPQTG